MARFGKYTSWICVLAALVLLEFVGLVGALAWIGGREAEPADLSVPVQEEPPDMPAWLAPASGASDAPAPPPQAGEKERPAGELTAAEILGGSQIIAHGMGSVDGEAILNCLEGFQEQYEKGVRVFEVDLRLTADQQVVLRHDWRAGWQEGISETAVPTLEEFLDKPLLGKYTPLSFRDLLELMEDYPDICVVTDSKFTDAEIVRLQFEAMVRDARELGLSYLLDRVAVQVYDPLMFKVVDSVHHFRHYIYTLYVEGFGRTEASFRERALFCAQNGIQGITMWDTWWDGAFAPIAARCGIKVYTHTVNDPQQASALLESGVAAVYTDELAPAALDPEAAQENTDTPPEGGESGEASPEEKGDSEHGAD
ncbi:MAG: hypothetical protein HFF65_11540 [Oscillospiraceae bacterium]|jgi:glycerophosphoryl diester phosphodiesterase|nr:hypothetical protein [Oscillospiraceae bacterium]